jgi:YD repeat-containing protein
MIHRATLFCALLLLATLALTTVSAQTGYTTRYVYDNKGQLRAVIAPNGEAAVYEYDPAGNFTAIRRLTASDFEVIEFTPRQGAIGSTVTIYGVGFNGNITAVAFNGTSAQILSQTPTSIVTTVPLNATSGPISVTGTLGTAISKDPFTISGVSVIPLSSVIKSGQIQQFTAIVSGLSDSSLIWSVNGFEGGNSSVGTISTTGYYVAPVLQGGPNGLFTIRATSTFDTSIYGEANLTVLSQGAGFEAIGRGVSIRYGNPVQPARVPVWLSNGLSVRYGTPLPQTSVATYVNSGLSVRYGTPVPQTSVATYVTNGVSVQLGQPIPPSQVSVQVQGQVSVSRSPSIISVSPSQFSKGTTIPLSITGGNLQSPTEILFITDNGAIDSTITTSSLSTNSAGTLLTAQVVVGSATISGPRIVLVRTAQGATLPVKSIANEITILP